MCGLYNERRYVLRSGIRYIKVHEAQRNEECLFLVGSIGKCMIRKGESKKRGRV